MNAGRHLSGSPQRAARQGVRMGSIPLPSVLAQARQRLSIPTRRQSGLIVIRDNLRPFLFRSEVERQEHRELPSVAGAFMRGLAMENRETKCRNRETRPADYGLENAFARKVRRESPSNTIDHTAATYGLTEGRARGAVYGTASLTTLNIAIKKAGWRLAIEIIGEVLGQTLWEWLEEEAERKRDECQQLDRMERTLRTMVSDLPSVLGLDSPRRN